MANSTLARIPADASGDLVYALYTEGRKQTPADDRSTCPTHLNWVVKCSHLHVGGER